MLTLESQAQVGELGILLEITLETHRQVPIPLRKFHLGPTHLRKPDTQTSTKVSISNTSLRMILRYTGNTPEYHSQVDTGNGPAKVLVKYISSSSIMVTD